MRRITWRALLSVGLALGAGGDAWAADTGLAVYDTGWSEEGDAPAPGPVAIRRIDSTFAGATDHLVIADDYGLVSWTWLPSSRDDAAEGVLLPVPAGTTWDQVARVNSDLVRDLDIFTQPWFWEETCGQVLTAPPAGCDTGDDRAADRSGSAGGCLSSDGSGTEDTETGGGGQNPGGGDDASVTLGEYDAWLVEPGDGALADALETAGIEATGALLDAAAGWSGAGGGFLLLRLDPYRDTNNWPTPSSIRVTMVGDVPPIPLGMGTLGGDDTRDLIVTVLSAEATSVLPAGSEPAAPEDCLAEVDEAEGSVEDSMAESWWAASGLPPGGEPGAGPAWAWEAWLPEGVCYDCQTFDTLSTRVTNAVGMASADPGITRLRVRAHRAAVPSPMVLEAADAPRVGIKRVVAYRWELAGILPMCDGSAEEGGGTCFSAAWWAARADGTHADEDIPIEKKGCLGGRASLLLPLLLLVGWRRR